MKSSKLLSALAVFACAAAIPMAASADPPASAEWSLTGYATGGVDEVSGDGHVALQFTLHDGVHVLRDTGGAWHTTATLPVTTANVYRAAISGDGRTIALVTSAGTTIRRLDATGHWAVVAEIPVDAVTYYPIPTNVSLSQDGSVVLVAFVPRAGAWSANGLLYRAIPAGGYERFGPAIVSPDPKQTAIWFQLDGAADRVAITTQTASASDMSHSTYVVDAAEGYAVPHPVAIDHSLGFAAMSRDGSTVAVPGRLDGTVEVYRHRADGTWHRTGSFHGTYPYSAGTFGGWVAVSANGSTLLVADEGRNSVQYWGATYRYVYSGGSWHYGGMLRDDSHQTIAPGPVWLSSDGKRALIDAQDERAAHLNDRVADTFSIG